MPGDLLKSLLRVLHLLLPCSGGEKCGFVGGSCASERVSLHPIGMSMGKLLATAASLNDPLVVFHQSFLPTL